jgi:hypothetical protein
MDNAWPRAIGTSALATALPFRSCIPSATAKSHPIPGLIPFIEFHSALRVRVKLLSFLSPEVTFWIMGLS